MLFVFGIFGICCILFDDWCCYWLLFYVDCCFVCVLDFCSYFVYWGLALCIYVFCCFVFVLLL